MTNSSSNAERQLQTSEAAMNLMANPSFRNGDFGASGRNGGQIIIARGFHDGGEQQERIILHPGGPPSAPPAQPHHQIQQQQQQELSPVFIMAPSSQSSSSSQRIRNLNVMQPPPPITTTKGSNPSLPSFGGSIERFNSNDLRSPLLQKKISRTPLPIIGGKFM